MISHVNNKNAIDLFNLDIASLSKEEPIEKYFDFFRKKIREFSEIESKKMGTHLLKKAIRNISNRAYYTDSCSYCIDFENCNALFGKKGAAIEEYFDNIADTKNDGFYATLRLAIETIFKNNGFQIKYNEIEMPIISWTTKDIFVKKVIIKSISNSSVNSDTHEFNKMRNQKELIDCTIEVGSTT
jgi:hypothetical protein